MTGQTTPHHEEKQQDVGDRNPPPVGAEVADPFRDDVARRLVRKLRAVADGESVTRRAFEEDNRGTTAVLLPKLVFHPIVSCCRQRSSGPL